MTIKWRIMDGQHEITSDFLDVHPNWSTRQIMLEVIEAARIELANENFYEGHNITGIEWEEH